MATDITGPYNPADDYLLPTCPDDPAIRESVSMWISDDAGRFGFPRMAVEVIAEAWDTRGIQANIAFPDGRVLVGAGGFSGAAPVMSGGKAVTLNAGPLTFAVKEPLRRWTMTFDGDAYETTVRAQVEGNTEGPRRKVLIEVDAVMAAPPWSPGERAVQSGDDATALAIGAVGGHRFEQLFRCSGRFLIEGEEERLFTGTGLRIRRAGVREMNEFPGHCWMSALFPSGKAFGVLAFPPRLDGTAAYSEAFVLEGGKKRYGTVAQAPWLTRFEPHGGKSDLVLQMDDGEQIRIAGRTHNSTFIRQGVPVCGDQATAENLAGMSLPFAQGDCLYTWDGESAYGMTERSLPVSRWE